MLSFASCYFANDEALQIFSYILLVFLIFFGFTDAINLNDTYVSVNCSFDYVLCGYVAYPSLWNFVYYSFEMYGK